jgi:hypothetical protein
VQQGRTPRLSIEQVREKLAARIVGSTMHRKSRLWISEQTGMRALP